MVGRRPAKRRVSSPSSTQGMGSAPMLAVAVIAVAYRGRRSRRKVAVSLCGDQALADAVRLLLAGRVVRDREPQGPGVCPGPPRSCSIMTEPIRRRIMQVIGRQERRRPRLASAGRRLAGSM